MNGQETRELLHEIVKSHAAGLGCENHCTRGRTDDQCENCQLLVDDILDTGFVRLPKIGDTVYLATPAHKYPQMIKIAQIRYCDYGSRKSIYVEDEMGYGGCVGANVYMTLNEAKCVTEGLEK